VRAVSRSHPPQIGPGVDVPALLRHVRLMSPLNEAAPNVISTCSSCGI
jgi:hypothetical protein